MPFYRLAKHFDDLTEQIEKYVDTTFRYYKLSLFKQLMKAFSTLTKLLVLGSFLLVFLGFVSVGIAILIGKSVGSFSLGFFIVGGFYLFVFLVLWAIWKNKIERFFLKKFSAAVFQKEDDDDERIQKEMAKTESSQKEE